jgi:hypothetical protein
MRLRERAPAELATGHAVRFYRSDEALAQIVADAVGRGLEAEQPALIVATPDHLALIVRELQLRGVDLEHLRLSRLFLVRDAARTLNDFMIDGVPDSSLFGMVMHPLLEELCQGRPGRIIHVYGEMVDVLWKRGETRAAIQLEMLWNDLANRHEFSLLCGYAMGNFYKDVERREICSHHTHSA